MLTNEQECLNELLRRSEAKGFLTHEEIENLEDSFNVSISGADRIINAIILRGVLVYEKHPETEVKESVNDYSQTDYDGIFDEVLAISKEHAPLIKAIKTFAPPQWNEVKRLVAQIRDGNSFARERLIKCYLRNAIKIALSSTKKYHLDIDEAISSSIIGLVRSVDRYVADNPPSSIISYTSLAIINTIQASCKPTAIIQSLPLYALADVASVLDSYVQHGCEYCQDQEICPRLVEEVAHNLDISQKEAFKRIELLTSLSRDKLGLNELREYNEKLYWKIFSYTEEPGSRIDNYLVKDVLSALVDRLPEREREIISLRFGINSFVTFTLEDVAKRFNLTRERVRQIERRGLGQLKSLLIKSRIASYIEDLNKDDSGVDILSFPQLDANNTEKESTVKKRKNKRKLSIKKVEQYRQSFHQWLSLQLVPPETCSIYWRCLKRVIKKAVTSELLPRSFNGDDLERINANYSSIDVFQKHVFSSSKLCQTALGFFVDFWNSDDFEELLSDGLTSNKPKIQYHPQSHKPRTSQDISSPYFRSLEKAYLNLEKYKEKFHHWLQKNDFQENIRSTLWAGVKRVVKFSVERKIIEDSFDGNDLRRIEKEVFSVSEKHANSLSDKETCALALKYFIEFWNEDSSEEDTNQIRSSGNQEKRSEGEKETVYSSSKDACTSFENYEGKYVCKLRLLGLSIDRCSVYYSSIKRILKEAAERGLIHDPFYVHDLERVEKELFSLPEYQAGVFPARNICLKALQYFIQFWNDGTFDEATSKERSTTKPNSQLNNGNQKKRSSADDSPYFEDYRDDFYRWLLKHGCSKSDCASRWSCVREVIQDSVKQGVIVDSFDSDDLRKIEKELLSTQLYKDKFFPTQQYYLSSFRLFINYWNDGTFDEATSKERSTTKTKRRLDNGKQKKRSSAEDCPYFEDYRDDFYSWLQKHGCSKSDCTPRWSCVKRIINDAVKQGIIIDSFDANDLRKVEKQILSTQLYKDKLFPTQKYYLSSLRLFINYWND